MASPDCEYLLSWSTRHDKSDRRGFAAGEFAPSSKPGQLKDAKKGNSVRTIQTFPTTGSEGNWWLEMPGSGSQPSLPSPDGGSFRGLATAATFNFG